MKLKQKILLSAIIPILILGIISSVFSGISVKNTIQDMSKQQLRVAALAGLKAYESINKDDYVILLNGKLGKGIYFELTDYTKPIDSFKENTNLEYTFFYGKDIVATTIKDDKGKKLTGFEAEKQAIVPVITEGKQYFSTNTVIGGKQYYGYYVPVKQVSSNAVIGMFFAGVPKASMDSNIRNAIISNTVTTLVIMVISIVILLGIMRILIKSLKRSVKNLESVASGKLNFNVISNDLKRKDEIGDIARATQKVKSSMKKMISKISETTGALSDYADDLKIKAKESTRMTNEVETAVDGVAKSSTEQAESTQEAAQGVMVIGQMVENSVKKVNELNENSKEMSRVGNEVIKTLENLSDSNIKTTEAVKDISVKAENTNICVKDIKEATELITDIASETTLLALNANIEAARAGEHGRGFAVVANQIQELANQSTLSAQKIQDVINSLINNSNETVETMKMVKEIIEMQSENVEKTKDTFAMFNKGIDVTNDSVKEIYDNVMTLDRSRNKIVDDIQKLTSIAEENAATTQESAAITSELNKIMNNVDNSAEKINNVSNKLCDEINIFEI